MKEKDKHISQREHNANVEMIPEKNSIPGSTTLKLSLEYFTESCCLEKGIDTKQKQYIVSERSQLRINLKAEVGAVSFYSRGPGSLTKAQGGNEEKTGTHRERNWVWLSGLSRRSCSTLEAQRVDYIQLNREAELLHTAGDQLAHLGRGSLWTGAILGALNIWEGKVTVDIAAHTVNIHTQT